MTRMTAGDVRKSFSEALSRVALGGDRIVLQRYGKDVAALVSMDDLELLRELEDRIDLEAARKALREKGTVSWKKLKAELDL